MNLDRPVHLDLLEAKDNPVQEARQDRQEAEVQQGHKVLLVQ